MNSNAAIRFKPARTKATWLPSKSVELTRPMFARCCGRWRLRVLELRTRDYFRQGSSLTALILAHSLRTMLKDEVIQEQSRLKD